MIQYSFGQYSVWFITVSDSIQYDSAQFRTVLSMIQHSFGQYSVWFSTVSGSTQYDSAQFWTALSMTDLEALYMSRCCLGLHPVLLSSIQYHLLLHRTALTPWKILLFLWLYMFNFWILCSSTGAVQNCTLLWKKIWPWKLTHLIT